MITYPTLVDVSWVALNGDKEGGVIRDGRRSSDHRGVDGAMRRVKPDTSKHEKHSTLFRGACSQHR